VPAATVTATPTTPGTAATPAGPTVLTGRWQASCDGNNEVYPVTMRQDGNRLQVVVEGQAQYQGTFDGHRLKGTSADGLDSFDGTAVSPTELRLDWEGRTSADSPVYHNTCTLRRDGPPPVAATTPASAPPKTAPVAPPATSTGPPATSATPPPFGAVPCKRDGRNPFEEDLCIEIDKAVPVAPR
jgi:hypothetical protein